MELTNNILDTEMSSEKFDLNAMQIYFNQIYQANYNPKQIKVVVNNLIDSFKFDVDHFPLKKNGYSRTILFMADNNLEIMIARWDKDTKSPVHGHPDFIYEHLISGCLIIENFDKDEAGIKKTETIVQNPDDSIWNHGIKGNYDNAIHCISAEEESLSLHIYSDDGLKGKIFTDQDYL